MDDVVNPVLTGGTGIEKLKEALGEVKEVVNQIGVILEDGKLSLSDLFKLPGLVGAGNKLVKAVVAAAPEVKDLSVEEAVELAPIMIEVVALIASKFGYAAK